MTRLIIRTKQKLGKHSKKLLNLDLLREDLFITTKLTGNYCNASMQQVVDQNALKEVAMCVQVQPSARPVMADVVIALSYLASEKHNPQAKQIKSFETPSSTISPQVMDLRASKSSK